MNELNVSMIQNRIEKMKRIVDEKTFRLKNQYVNEYINKINEIEVHMKNLLNLLKSSLRII